MSKQEDGRRTDGQTHMQTDRRTDSTRLGCGHAKTTTQRSIYNSLNMFRITMYLYVESDFFSVGISYTGIQRLYLIIKVCFLRSLCDGITQTHRPSCQECSAISVVLYSEIKILSTPVVIHTVVSPVEMNSMFSS